MTPETSDSRDLRDFHFISTQRPFVLDRLYIQYILGIYEHSINSY